MSTITLEDVQQNAKNKPPPKVSLYSPVQCRESWELYRETNQERGVWMERVVAERIQRHTGYETKWIEGSKACDVIVNLGHEIVRVEVKSSLSSGLNCDSSVNGYRMQGIKCEKFDYIFIVLITPNGIIFKWATVEDIERDLTNRREKNGHNKVKVGGECLNLSVNKIPKYFNDLEDFTL